MPQVVKQARRRDRPSTGGGISSRIVPVASMDVTGLRLCLYGRSKVGKTSLACTFPKPLLILGTEDGTKSIQNVKGVDFVRLQHSTEVEEAAELVEGKYKTVVLDTAGGLQDLILKEILGLADVPVEKSWGLAQQKEWQVCGMQTKQRLGKLLNLSETYRLASPKALPNQITPRRNLHLSPPTNIVIVAHERSFNDDGEASVLFPTVGAALTPSVAGWLNGECDYLCQAFIREATEVRRIKVGGKITESIKHTGDIEYCLRVRPHPVYMTGFRCVRREGFQLPEAITDPSYEKIVKLINGEE